MMTHKDFVVIADAIRRAGLANSTAGHQIAVGDVAITMAGALAATNPRFDRSRFLAACKGEHTTGRDRVRS